MVADVLEKQNRHVDILKLMSKFVCIFLFLTIPDRTGEKCENVEVFREPEFKKNQGLSLMNMYYDDKLCTYFGS